MANYFLIFWAALLIGALVYLLIGLVPEYLKKLDQACDLPGDYLIPGFEEESLVYSRLLALQPYQVYKTKIKGPLSRKYRQKRTSAADIANGVPSKKYITKTKRNRKK